MVVNYVREQLELGLIQVFKIIKGELNKADLHTKKLRDKSLFATKTDNILGSIYYLLQRQRATCSETEAEPDN